MVVQSVRGSILSPAPPVTRRAERGIALLEVLVAMLILSLAGVAAVELVATGLRAQFDAAHRERTLADEERLLAATTLLKREELNQRLGRRTVGEFLVDIQRPERTLYRIGLLQAGNPQVEDLVTVIYR